MEIKSQVLDIADIPCPLLLHNQRGIGRLGGLRKTAFMKAGPTLRHGRSETPFREGRAGHSAPWGYPKLNLRMLLG
jgi:hypothetical protein